MLPGDELEDHEPDCHPHAGEDSKRAEGSEEVQRARHIAEKKADGEQVEEDAEGAGETIMRLPCRARWISNGDFADAGAIPGGKRRDEAMHLAVERDVLDHFAAIGFEGGAEVVDVDATENRHQRVCRAGRNAAEKKIVRTLGTPTADDVVTLFEFGEEGGDLIGVVLEVAIHSEDVVALGVIEAGGEGGGLAEVAAELDDEDAAIYRSDLFEQAIGAVTGAIVDKDQFEGFTDLLHDGLEAIVERGDVILFVVEWHDDGIFRHCLMILLGLSFLNPAKRCFRKRFMSISSRVGGDAI